MGDNAEAPCKMTNSWKQPGFSLHLTNAVQIDSDHKFPKLGDWAIKPIVLIYAELIVSNFDAYQLEYEYKIWPVTDKPI